jgi:hypothetical protein
MQPVPNPERHWERARPGEDEVRRRLGLEQEPVVEVLSGGQANLCVRVGDRVLRAYEREPESLLVEAALLVQPWRSFRVPRLLQRGEGQLWLEFVPHDPLPGSFAAGETAGRALRELHAKTYPEAGFLDGTLQLARSLGDLWSTFAEHISTRSFDPALRERVLQRWSRDEPALRRASAHDVLLHGDFKPANLGWTAAGELLVLDWEFAYAGPASLDLGQLLRWDPPEPFVRGLRSAYGRVDVRLAETFDLVNLAGLLHGVLPGSRRHADVTARMERTLRWT